MRRRVLLRDVRAAIVVRVGLVVGEHFLAVFVGADDGGFAVEQVDLLEREALGFGDEEEGEEEA